MGGVCAPVRRAVARCRAMARLRPLEREARPDGGEECPAALGLRATSRRFRDRPSPPLPWPLESSSSPPEPWPELLEPGPELSSSSASSSERCRGPSCRRCAPPAPVQRGSLACSASSHGPLMSSPARRRRRCRCVVVVLGRCVPVQRGSLACSASSHGPLTSSPPVGAVVVPPLVVVASVGRRAVAAAVRRGDRDADAERGDDRRGSGRASRGWTSVSPLSRSGLFEARRGRFQRDPGLR